MKHNNKQWKTCLKTVSKEYSRSHVYVLPICPCILFSLLKVFSAKYPDIFLGVHAFGLRI